MGILPLEFQDGNTWKSTGLTGKETFSIPTLSDKLEPRSTIEVIAVDEAGKETKFNASVRIDTPVEMDYYRNGGILQTVLRNLL